MGLAERRVTEEIKTSFEDKWLKDIQTAAKTKLPVSVEWDSMVKEGQAHYALEAFEKVFVRSLVEAFQSICRDDMGKKAFSNGVKKIVIKNTTGNSNAEKWCSMNDGVITLDHEFSNIDFPSDRAKGLITLLEKKL